jgi:hypothetical protein
MNRLRQLRNDERGFALIMALGALTVLSFVIISVVDYTSSNSREASASKSSNGSYALAEAGLNKALAVIYGTSTPLFASLLPSTTDYYNENMTAVSQATSNYNTWSGTLDTSNPNASCPGHAACWLVTSTGYVRNPAGGSKPETRALSIKVPIDPVYAQPLVNPAYDYVFVYGTGAPSGCDFSATNSSGFSSALYVQGNLCLSNSAKVLNELHVWGHVDVNSPQSSIGTSTTYDTYGVHIKNGCKYSAGYVTPCTTNEHVYANPVDDGNPRTLSPPNTDYQGWYLQANPGPYYPCSTSSGSPSNTGSWATAFDGDQGSQPDATKMNRSVAGAFDLTPGSAYSCKTAFGELSYDPTTKVGSVTVPTLTVKGTVYIDGNARIAPGGIVRYTGVGSLYLSGSFVIKNTKVCAALNSGATDCDWSLPGSGHWDVASNFLEVVAGGVGGGGQSETPDSNTSVELQNSSWQGAMTASNKLDVGSSSYFQGPLVERSLVLGQSLTTYPFGTLSYVPTATPGNPVKAVNLGTPTGFGG